MVESVSTKSKKTQKKTNPSPPKSENVKESSTKYSEGKIVLVKQSEIIVYIEGIKSNIAVPRIGFETLVTGDMVKVKRE